MANLWHRRVAVLFLLAVGFTTAGISFISNVVQPPLQSNIPTERSIYAAAYGEKSLAAMNTTVGNGVIVGYDYHHDTSPPLRDMPQYPMQGTSEREASPNPKTGIKHKDAPDSSRIQRSLSPNVMPAPILNFNGIPFPGVGCNCAPPDTDGEAGQTQYVQMVNEGYQVFNKTTGASLLGPSSISSVWTGFGGACELGGAGDPVVLYDQLANRWVISQFASANGGTPITDECIAVSTSSDATGSWNRYGFTLGTNFYDYPKLGLWPDAYYMSMNVFNAAGTNYLGPQPFAFNRAAMIAGSAASFVSPVGPLGSTVDPFLPADLDGSILPTAGAPESFIGYPGAGGYTTYHFHVDFAVPANSTFTTFANPAAAGFTALCPTTRACVPQSGSADNLDAIADRLMFRAAYRKFSDGRESLVSNYTVSSNGVAGIRWFELRNVTAGPVTVFQESTYQPDTTWRWMGSAAMDTSGDLALGFSASSATIFPQIRYAGRLANDPINTLAQGETTLFAGTGSQTATGNRWGDYSDMTIDPVDDCTFWFTSEYYPSTSSFNWRTRIGNFKFPSCNLATPTPTVTGTPPTATPTNTPTITPSPTATPCVGTYTRSTATGATIVPGTQSIGNNTDDGMTTIGVPFAFKFYGSNFNSVNVDSNGNLQFSSNISTYNNAALPYPSFDNAIMPLWDDLRTDGSGSGVFTSTTGAAPNRIFNIEWRATYFSGGATTNFEVQLYETTGQINFIYGVINGTGSSATVGIQKGTAGPFDQFEYNTGGLSQGFKITYLYNDPCTATPVPPTNTATATSVPPTATRTATPVPPTNTATATSVPPTATRTATPVPPTNTATATSVPPTNTNTAVPPTNTATATTVPPTNTNTAVPPTNTNTAVPPTNTATSVPPTNTATATSVPPTNTATATTVPPTNTATSVPPTNTNTAVPPTNTNTAVPPTNTATSVPPTNTNTAVPPTNTNTAVPPTNTNTAVPPTSTNTPVPATDTPTSTNTPVPPTSTNTPIPPQPTATTCPNPFVDINGNVFYNAIMYLYCRGVVNGVDATHYGPAGTATRAQFAKVVVLGFAIPAFTPNGGTSTFTDVPNSYFAYQYIETGYAAGVLSGFDSATCAQIGATYPCYGPNRAITRAQLTKLVVNAGGFSLFTPTSGQTFTDVGPSNVFYVSIETAAHYGIVGGYIDGSFRPNNNIRRDEMAQIVYKGIITPPLRRK